MNHKTKYCYIIKWIIKIKAVIWVKRLFETIKRGAWWGWGRFSDYEKRKNLKLTSSTKELKKKNFSSKDLIFFFFLIKRLWFVQSSISMNFILFTHNYRK